MCIVLPPTSKSEGLIALANPRTGSQATRKALMSVPGMVRVGGHHIKMPLVLQFSHTQPMTREKLQRPLEGLATCVAVRNHYDALATWFQIFHNGTDVKRKHHKYPTIRSLVDGFMLDKWGVTENRLWEMHPNVTHVMRYESLQDDLNNVLAEHGHDPVAIPVHNVTRHKKPYREYYSSDDVKAVQDRFGDEMIELGYSLEL